ncbi:uncharacterized protein LOC143572997 [Bidens hawaiensis]|uniref:uncharacterized protein LOC143572997 n=1 Tax=Bidens hawaiensis TaxID=980011 RepID=UPI00404A0D0D
MGFDNECILNIQSLAGEYFCPVCRTLVYPHEAIQTQCTHLYCKPCLSYVVSSTRACPYDGYLVTEAGSKPLVESNKALADTIGKTTVHCLYHRSGCVWQGPLSECTTHCTACSFGNSPVVCNRCGIQIVHRQVQEHAQTCNVNGTNTQPQGSEAGVVSTDQSKVSNQAVAPPSGSQPQTSHTAVGPAAQNLNQPATSNPFSQAMPAPEQQYYQQYQQYYQQYPGYDPYQQAYQQYYPYQQQPAQQVQQPPLQPQSQPVQLQVQAPIPPVQPQVQNQPQPHPQAQSQVPANGPPQPLNPQAAVVGSTQNQGQVSSQPQGHSGSQPVAHGHVPVQPYSQVQPHLVQSHAQPPMQVPQYQQPVPQMQHPQPPQVQPYPQTQPQPQPQAYPQPPTQLHPQPQPQPQLQPINLQHPPAGHPPQPQQQIQHAPPQQYPMQGQPPSGSLPPQFPPPPPLPPHMRPPQPPHMLPPQQRPVSHQVQQPIPPQYSQQPQGFPGQMPGQLQGQPRHAAPFAHQQVRPQVPPQQMQQPSTGFAQPQQGNALPHSMPPYVGGPATLNQGGQQQQYPQSYGSASIAPPARPPQFGLSQPYVNQSNVNQQQNEYAPPSGGDQTLERRVERQEVKSPSLKKSEPVINDFGAKFNEVKPEAGMKEEFKCEDGNRKDETLIKDAAVSELHQAQGVPGDSASSLRVKEENKDGATTDSTKQGDISMNFHGSSQAGNGPFNSHAPHGQIGEQSTHPPVPYGFPGQQQRPVAPMSLQSTSNAEQAMGHSPSHLRPPGHGYLPHGPHPGEQFQPPGPNQPRPFHPEVPSGGPSSFANPRGNEPHGKNSRVSEGDPLGPPLPHGHHGPMESQFDSRRQDSHLPGNLDRGPYRPPYGVESNLTRMNGAAPPGFDLLSAPVFGDEKFRTSNNFHMPPTRHPEESFKQFPEGSPKFGSHLSRPPRFYEKDPHGYGYDAGPRLPPYHPNDSGGRPLPGTIHDNRGRFEHNHQNPDFHGPVRGFGQHHMDRLPPISPRSLYDGRNMDRQPFGERFPMGPPGHMHRGEFEGPQKPMNGEPCGPREPGFGSFHDYGRSGEPNGPGGFSHQPRFGELFGPKPTRPRLDEPIFRNCYSRQGFPSDGGFYSGGPDSFNPSMKRKTFSVGWCRICKVDCESVEGLEMHGQTREHQRMSMDMVISVKKKNGKRQRTSMDREETDKFRNPEINARPDMS